MRKAKKLPFYFNLGICSSEWTSATHKEIDENLRKRGKRHAP